MKKNIFLLAIFGTLFTVHCSAQWFKLNTGVDTNNLYSVFFPNSNVGYAVGYYNVILKTTDAGIHWEKQKIDFKYGYDISSVYFTDINTGYVVGYLDSILQTTNGGNTWIKKKLPDNGTNWQSIYFINKNTGYICGAGGIIQNIILKTTDAGENWFVNYSNKNIGDWFNSICFPDSNTGYAVGFNSIMNTTDGGKNWIQQKTNFELMGIYCTNINTCYAVGTNGYIVKTMDKGTNWKTLLKDTIIESFNSVYFPDSNTGYVVGYIKSMNPSGNGVIFKTTDAGKTWVKQDSGLNVGLNSLFFTNNKTGYATGGGILKTTDGGETWIEQLTMDNGQWTIYPNPTDQSTFINFKLTNTSFVSIKVYNLLGNDIAILENKEETKGDYKITFESKQFADGIYFIKLTVGQNSITKKLLIAH